MLNQFYDKFIFTNGLKFRHNNFFLINVPFLIVPAEVLAGLLSLDNPDFRKKVYLSVKESVQKNLMKDMSLEFGFKGERLAVFLRDYFSASGWGTIQFLDFNTAKTEAIVSLSDNPFASLVESPKAPIDDIFRGILAGVFSRAFEKNVDCVETHCSALGSQICEFVVRQQNAFDLSNKLVREQLEFEV